MSFIQSISSKSRRDDVYRSAFEDIFEVLCGVKPAPLQLDVAASHALSKTRDESSRGIKDKMKGRERISGFTNGCCAITLEVRARQVIQNRVCFHPDQAGAHRPGDGAHSVAYCVQRPSRTPLPLGAKREHARDFFL